MSTTMLRDSSELGAMNVSAIDLNQYEPDTVCRRFGSENDVHCSIYSLMVDCCVLESLQVIARAQLDFSLAITQSSRRTGTQIEPTFSLIVLHYSSSPHDPYMSFDLLNLEDSMKYINFWITHNISTLLLHSTIDL